MPLPSKVVHLIRSDFRCNEIVKYHLIIPLRDAIPIIKSSFHCRRNGSGLIRGNYYNKGTKRPHFITDKQNPDTWL